MRIDVLRCRLANSLTRRWCTIVPGPGTRASIKMCYAKTKIEGIGGVNAASDCSNRAFVRDAGNLRHTLAQRCVETA